MNKIKKQLLKNYNKQLILLDKQLEILGKIDRTVAKQLNLCTVGSSDCDHKANVLTKEEVEQGRSNAYKYLDIKQ